MDEELADILTRGRRIGAFPARHSETFIELLQQHFPQHRVGLLGEKQIELWVYPRLSDNEMATWQRVYLEKRQALGLKE